MKRRFGYGLAVAATSSLALAEGPDGPDKPPSPLAADAKVTFQPGKGITIDGGDDYLINVQHRIQAKWRYVDLDAGTDTNGFRVRRMRQKWSGHVFNEDVTYVAMFDFTESVAVKDAYLRYRFMNGDDSSASFRIGQMKTHHGLESDATSAGLEFVERSIASRTFADSRSLGALVEGYLLEDNKLMWWVGAFNSDTAAMSTAAAEEDRNNGENELNYTLGVRFNPQGEVASPEAWKQGDLDHSGELQSTIGASLWFGNDQSGAAGAGPGVETTSFNLNAGLKTGSGIAAEGEFWTRSDDLDGGADADANGWHLQGSYALAPEDGKTQWGGALRIAMVSLDDPLVLLMGAAPIEGSSSATALAAPGDVLEFNAAINAFYHKHALKTQLAYTYQKVDPDAGGEQDNHGIDIMVTAVF